MITFLERYLTRIPMYAVVGGSLGSLIAIAAVLPLFNLLPYSPFALLVSAITFAAAGVGASYILGKVSGVHSHLQSVFITSTILALLFTPSLDVAVLLQYALVSVIAQSSKFVVAYRGRHIFNPAALGAFIAGAILQLQFASWWVGSPVLAFFVALFGFFVLYKTRQLALGGVFLAVSMGILALTGVSPITAILSWPLLFIAGFMLSEPLTLPPRRWQKMIVAALAAILVALPFHIGWFYSSPEFALIVANVAAFILAFRQRAGLKLSLAAKRDLTPTTKEFVFTSLRPLVFEAGQYIELTLPHKHADSRGIRRSFSITNAPGTNELAIAVKFYKPSSSFKQTLATLPIGSSVQSTGITGDFVLPKDIKAKLLFIAGGIGITPFISHIRTARGQGRDIILLYLARDESELAFKEELAANDITTHYILGDAILNADTVLKHVPDAAQRVTYISGPPAMVTRASLSLRGKVKSIKTDYFSGY